MNELAILVEGTKGAPSAVRIAPDGRDLVVSKADGISSRIPFWRLFRVEDHGTTHRFRRLDVPNWELRVTSGSDRDLMAGIGSRRFARAFTWFHRFHGLKILLGLVVLTVTFASHMPASWTSGWIPPWAEDRLVSGMLGLTTNQRCTSEDGERALRSMLVRLDPQIGRSAKLLGIREAGLLVSALPGGTIVFSRLATTEIAPEAFAALLAHELSHLKHRDPITAAVRNYGFIGTWAAVMEGEDRKSLQLRHSSIDEERADLEAIAMMRRAGLSMSPAADLFQQMYIGSNTGSTFADWQRDFHFGVADRPRRWRGAAAGQADGQAASVPQEVGDAIFNYCWLGKVTREESAIHHPSREPPLEGQLGTGSFDSLHQQRP